MEARMLLMNFWTFSSGFGLWLLETVEMEGEALPEIGELWGFSIGRCEME